jgi:hypothetical protein
VASAKINVIKDGITKSLNEMIQRGRSPQAFLSTTAYKMYLNAQRMRWMTENSSEGQAWPQYEQTFATPEAGLAYRFLKLRKFSGFPGGGSKMMINTSTLLMSILGQGEGARKTISGSTLIVGTSIEYAQWVVKNRPMFRFRDLHQRISKEYAQWVMKGKTA